MMRKLLLSVVLMASAMGAMSQKVTSYVNPLLGTATLWEPEDLGFTRGRHSRVWGSEVFPGSSLPNAMVQATPVTQFGTGSGYCYEDQQIYGFAHTARGHWDLLHLPVMPVTGLYSVKNYASQYHHNHESAHPGYYQVYLERYHINAELTTTMRCAYHKYTFRPTDEKQLLVDITRNNNVTAQPSISNHEHTAGAQCFIEKAADNAFSGYQDGMGRIYFYAVTNYKVKDVRIVRENYPWVPRLNPGRLRKVALVDFEDSKSARPLEVKFGFSFVSVENAKANLEAEMLDKSFDEVVTAADNTWNALLGQIQVEGGTERQKGLFYSCLYRAYLWPALRSDVNGDYTDVKGQVVRGADFRYYTLPSFWDTYRNKLILLGLLSPDVAADVIKSITDMGEKQGGYMPTYFHGDHASTFVAGTWLRGVHGFDLKRVYKLLLNNATVPGEGGREFLDEYLANGWVAERDSTGMTTENDYKVAVTKTVEYAYDDYATALLAKELGDKNNYKLLMKNSGNYKNLFDVATGFWRARRADGSWLEIFDPYFPYSQYMFREANAWQSLFFAPHDPEGMIALYPSHKAVEQKLDSMFTEPWRGFETTNFSGFIGNYCHGNQPDHHVPYTYYFIDRQPKAQVMLDSIMNHFYDMGEYRLAYAGNDDCGEASSWYVMNALGLYTYSPADPAYIVTVPLFDKVTFRLPASNTAFTIRKTGKGRRIEEVTVGGKRLKGWFVDHADLAKGKEVVIKTTSE